MSTDGSEIAFIEFGPREDILAVADRDASGVAKVQLWQTATQVRLGRPMLLDAKTITALRFTRDSQQLAVGPKGSGNSGVWLFDLPGVYTVANSDSEVRLRTWVEVRTGMRWTTDSTGVDRLQALSYADWLTRCGRLEELGGPPDAAR
jgi:hypothetical protein